MIMPQELNKRLLSDFIFMNMITHELKIRRPPPRFLTPREPHQCRSLVPKTKKQKFLIGERRVLYLGL